MTGSCAGDQVSGPREGGGVEGNLGRLGLQQIRRGIEEDTLGEFAGRILPRRFQPAVSRSEVRQSVRQGEKLHLDRSHSAGRARGGHGDQASRGGAVSHATQASEASRSSERTRGLEAVVWA